MTAILGMSPCIHNLYLESILLTIRQTAVVTKHIFDFWVIPNKFRLPRLMGQLSSAWGGGQEGGRFYFDTMSSPWPLSNALGVIF